MEVEIYFVSYFILILILRTYIRNARLWSVTLLPRNLSGIIFLKFSLTDMNMFYIRWCARCCV